MIAIAKTNKKGGINIAAPRKKTHQRPSYALVQSGPAAFCLHDPEKPSASRSLATAPNGGALARGLLLQARD
jgi:hypothetical protein